MTNTDAAAGSTGSDLRPARGSGGGPAPTIPILATGLVMVAVVAAILAATIIGDAALIAIGFSAPGTATMIGGAIVRTATVLCASVTVGSLLFAVAIAPDDGTGRLSVDAFRAWETARRWSVAWVLTCLVLVPFAAATSVGVPVQELRSSGTLLTALEVSGTAKGALAAAALAALVAVGCRIALSWPAGVGLWLVALAGTVAPLVTANPAQGAGHDLATSAAVVHGSAAACWIGGGWSMLVYLRHRRTPADPVVARRFMVLSVGALLAVAGSGSVLAVTTGGGFSADTAYGRVLLAKVALTVLVAVGAGWATRRALRSTRTWTLLLVCQLGAIAAAFGLSSAMAQQPAPPAVTGGESQSQLLIGYDLLDPPGAVSLAITWRFDLVIGLGAIMLAALYLAGVLRLRRRGLRWPPGRTAAWMAGCLLVVVATSSGAAAYAGALFSVHMVVHMTLSMIAPILLVLGGPVTLALTALDGAGRAGPREWLILILDTRPVRALTSPVVAIPVYAVSLYGLYFTGLLEVALRYHWGHLLMNGWFLITGYLFYWGVVGIDPLPRRLPFIGRVAALIAIMPFHAVFGVLVMNSARLLAPQFYGSVDVPWLADQLADQRLGGVVAWAAGVIPLLIAVTALCVQWYRADEPAGPAPNPDLAPAGSATSPPGDPYQHMLDRLARMRR